MAHPLLTKSGNRRAPELLTGKEYGCGYCGARFKILSNVSISRIVYVGEEFVWDNSKTNTLEVYSYDVECPHCGIMNTIVKKKEKEPVKRPECLVQPKSVIREGIVRTKPEGEVPPELADHDLGGEGGA